MDRTKGSKMDEGSFKAFCQGRIEQLNRIYDELLMWPEAPEEYKPKAKIYEVDAARRVFSLLLKGKIKEAMKWFRALPPSIGRCSLMSDDFLVHLDMAEFAYLGKTGDIISYVGARNRHIDDPWSWVDVRGLIKELKMPKDTVRPLAWLNEKGYTLKLHGIGYVRCVGTSKLTVSFDDPKDLRTFKDLKIINEKECGREFFSNEPWHRYRCRECDRELKRIRDMKVPGKTMRNTEDEINRLLADLD